MSFMGTVGVVAQAGQEVATAPTNVSVATSSSGNYNNSVETALWDGSSSWSPIHEQAGGVASNSVIVTELDITAMDIEAANGSFNANSLQIRIAAYLRATGATSFSWSLHSLTDDLNGATASLITGNMSTSQDGVTNASVGIGGYVKIDAGGGRGQQTWGDENDWIQFKVRGTATNSAGNTTTNDITIKIVWTLNDSGD